MGDDVESLGISPGGAVNKCEQGILGLFGVIFDRARRSRRTARFPCLTRFAFPVAMIIDALQVVGLSIRSSSAWPKPIWQWIEAFLGLWRLIFSNLTQLRWVALAISLIIVWVSLVTAVY